MLLQRLVEFADQQTERTGDIVPPYYARKPVRWFLSLDAAGVPLQQGLAPQWNSSVPEMKNGVLRLVPAVTRTVGVAPALAVDTGEYLFGWVTEGAKPDRVAKQHSAFRDLIDDWAKAEPDGPGPAIAEFYRQSRDTTISRPDEWKRGDLIAIQVGDDIACETPAAIRFWGRVAGDRKGSGAMGICLVCNTIQPLLKTIPQQIPQRWLPGATQSASLVSVNEATHGYELQKFLVHTPICAGCGLRFMQALTTLLSDAKHSAALPGQNARLVWWVRGSSTFDPMALLEQPNEADVQALLQQPIDGVAIESDVDRSSAYCSMAVGGNVARVMVRDWVEMPVPEVKANIIGWFSDHEIVDVWTGEVTHIPLRQLVRAAGRWQTGRGGARGTYLPVGAKGEDRPPSTFSGLWRAAVLGHPLPPRLLSHVLNRISQDGRVDTARAALVRLTLIRSFPAYRERFTPALNDAPKKPPAFVAGQIFAVLDDLQRTVFRVADQKLNTTFAERHFGRAIANPQVALIRGRRLATAWLRRLRGPRGRDGWAPAYERRLDELFASMTEMPTVAMLQQKGEFILGYHHQRAAMKAELDAAQAGKSKTQLPPAPDEALDTQGEAA